MGCKAHCRCARPPAACNSFAPTIADGRQGRVNVIGTTDGRSGRRWPGVRLFTGYGGGLAGVALVRGAPALGALVRCWVHWGANGLRANGLRANGCDSASRSLVSLRPPRIARPSRVCSRSTLPRAPARPSLPLFSLSLSSVSLVPPSSLFPDMLIFLHRQR